MVTVERDGNYLVYKRDGVEFYDTAIPDLQNIGALMRHMDGKNWFSDVRSETFQLIVDALESAA